MNTQKELTLSEMITEVQTALVNQSVANLSKDTKMYFEGNIYDLINADEPHNLNLVNNVFEISKFRKLPKRNIDVLNELDKFVSKDKTRPHHNTIQVFDNKLVGTNGSSMFIVESNNHINQLSEVLKAEYRNMLKENMNALIQNFGKAIIKKDFNLAELVGKLKFGFELQKSLKHTFNYFSVVDFEGNYYQTKEFFNIIKFFYDLDLENENVTIEVGSYNIARLTYDNNVFYIGEQKKMSRGFFGNYKPTLFNKL